MRARFAGLTGTVILLSGGDLDCSRYHLMGALPWLTLNGKTNETAIAVDGTVLSVDGSPFDVLRSVIEQYDLPKGKLAVSPGCGTDGLSGL